MSSDRAPCSRSSRILVTAFRDLLAFVLALDPSGSAERDENHSTGPAPSILAARRVEDLAQVQPGRATLPSTSTTDRLTLIGIALAAVIAIVTMGNGNVNARVGDLHADVNTRLDRLESRMDTRMDGFDARLRAVEIAFGKVDQRLATLERAIRLEPSEGSNSAVVYVEPDGFRLSVGSGNTKAALRLTDRRGPAAGVHPGVRSRRRREDDPRGGCAMKAAVQHKSPNAPKRGRGPAAGTRHARADPRHAGEHPARLPADPAQEGLGLPQARERCVR